MVDDKKPEDDGYTFSELDDLNLHAEESPFGQDEHVDNPDVEVPPRAPAVNVRRNALIAIGIVALLMIGYKFVEAYMQRKHAAVPKSQVTPTPIPAPRMPAPVESPQPAPKAPPTVMAPAPVDNAPVLRQLSMVESQQQVLRSSIDSLRSELSNMHSHDGDLADKVSQLTQTLSSLASKLEQQATQIEHLLQRTCRPKVTKRWTPRQPPPTYTMQAVIPGRAWLISENGATLTVNVGTTLPGYGVVKLIDAKQGRVLTSSGRIIRFGQ